MRNEERAAMRAGMAEESGCLELPETEKKEFKFKSIFSNGEGGTKKFGIRNLVSVFSVLLIGAAVYVNWLLFGGPEDSDDVNVDLPTQTGDTVNAGAEKEEEGTN